MNAKDHAKIGDEFRFGCKVRCPLFARIFNCRNTHLILLASVSYPDAREKSLIWRVAQRRLFVGFYKYLNQLVRGV
jgi:hypothetical protein